MSVRYPRDLLVRAAANSTSLVDLMRRVGAPMGSIAQRYLRRRLETYGIDTSHFVDEPLPHRERRSYSRERLSKAAAHSHSIREMLQYLSYLPDDSPYGHIRKKLDQFGIDTSHFTSGWGYRAATLPLDRLAPTVETSKSVGGVLRLLGLPDNGTSRRIVQRNIEANGLSVEHFTGKAHCRGIPSPYRKAAATVLRRLEPGSQRTETRMLRRALDELAVPHICAECGVGDVWQGRPLVLEIDHINGDRLDNRQANLRYLCPSCHSQTSTFSRGTSARPRGAAQ
ncbi:HNH endonuclease signature motif containing protein [Streptomyces sp. NPDC096176]|uniref:HNH endonuclease signature motif containing protein n=1 Tax=Streptomyces sp. NPDC096176 TaxID=3366079 RepID=UPI0038172B5E